MARSRGWRETSDALVRAGRSVGNASAMLNHAVAERLGLDPTAWECATLLFEHGPVTAGRLAELTGLTSGAVTGLVDRLEAAGYVRRERDPDDRRRVIVTLVPAAFAGVMPLFEPMLAEMHASHARYTEDQLAAIVECLQDAADVLRRHALRLRADAESRPTDLG
jgi:DNA-binding MarR family transcriptional regulator